jgi:transcriptional regulator with XRE-family HTH domain
MREAPHPIDQYVGARVRMRRVELEMSQIELGQMIGVSFQQVQKYEKGSNRISASRLKKIAAALQMPVSFFFEDLPDKTDVYSTPSPDFLELMTTSEGLSLIKALMRVNSRKIRRCIVELVEYLADNNTATNEEPLR